jgi:hypothetical protein
MNPRFAHDCDNPGCCTFVGITNRHDIYTSRSGSLIMRFGDEGPEYTSMPMEQARAVAKDNPEYFHAIQLVDRYEADLNRSWQASPDRSGGQFTDWEISDSQRNWR